jgi:uncharacterized membrane protein
MEEIAVEPHKSSLNMDANVAALIVYIATAVAGWIPYLKYFAWVVPLIFFVLEKQSAFVRFHSMQAFLLFVVDAVLSFIVSVVITGIIVGGMSTALITGVWGAYAVVTMIFGLLALAIGLTITVFVIIAMVKAYQYSEYKIPLVGEWSAKLGTKFGKTENA